jgi:hypothetical protein
LFCHVYSGQYVASSYKLNDTDNLLSGANREGNHSDNHADIHTKNYYQQDVVNDPAKQTAYVQPNQKRSILPVVVRLEAKR